jgi:diguanylate cyclase (GGDEF)-like protein/PAS domain S-box-containing protein
MFNKIRKADISLLLIAILGIGLSVMAFWYVKQWEYQEVIDDYKRQADAQVYTLRQTFTTFGNILYSINGLYHVNARLSRADFSQFVKRTLSSQSAIQAVEWLPYVPAGQSAEVENQVRSEGFKDFHFGEFSPQGVRHLAAPQDFYLPVLFTEPLANNVDSLGFEVDSNVVFKKALEYARDSGQMTSSGAVPLRIGHDQLLGLRVFVPVYEGEDEPQTLLLRQTKIVGFASAVVLVDSLVHSVLRLPKFKTAMFLQILDETPGTLYQQLYAPGWYDGTESTILFSVPLDLNGRQWRLVYSQLSDGSFNFVSWTAWGVLGLGWLFTLGLWRYLYITLNRAHWAEELVTMRTQSLSEANLALNLEIKAGERLTKVLEANRQRFQAIFNEAALGIAQIDLSNRILDSNRALQTLLRYREEDLQNRLLKDFAHPEDADLDLPLLEKMLAGKIDTYRVGKRYICKNGAIVWTTQSCSIVRETSNPFIINLIEDITERQMAEEGRLLAEKKYRDIFENAIEGIFQSTPAGRFLSVNPAFVRMFGYDSAEQLCTDISNIEQQLYVEPQRRADFMSLLESLSEVQDFEYQARCRDGSVIWVNETTWTVRDSRGQVRYYEGIIEDVTHRKMIEEKLRYDATHDQLTGLLNRTAFTTYLSEALLRLSAVPAKAADDFVEFAVLFVDLDRFKIVNDSMGHLVGDKLLTEIAHRLNYHCKEDVVARFGGDEFALMLENIPDLLHLEHRLQSIQQYLREPYVLRNLSFNTSASIGIALASADYASADEILRDADTAMYEAKKQGRGKSVIFQTRMHTRVVNLLRMETDLRKALERDEFSIFYQPIISLDNLHTIGLEALLRWHHPVQGLISPDLFIPLAEETGLIKELGLWVFETACTQLRHWQTKFLHHANLGMNINVSAIQLGQRCLVRQVQDILEKTGIASTTCRIEITESAMMQDPEAALEILNDLKCLEVLLYVDDFGTGYSSLSYLQRFPIDALKIDKSFIRDIDSSGKSAQLVQAIIALGNAFDLRVVAEGVENSSQLAMLKSAHCHQVQGYFFARPQDCKAIENYLSLPPIKIMDNG